MIRPNGPQVRELRKKKLWSQEELAAHADCSSRAIQRIEQSQTVRYSTLRLVATALGVDPQGLMAGWTETNGDEDTRNVDDGELVLLGINVCEAIAAELRHADRGAYAKTPGEEFHGKFARQIDFLTNNAAYNALHGWSKAKVTIKGEDIVPADVSDAAFLGLLDALDGTEHWARGGGCNLYCHAISFFRKETDRWKLRVSVVMAADGSLFYAREDVQAAFFAGSRQAYFGQDPEALSVTEHRPIELVRELRKAHVATVARRPDHFKALWPLLKPCPCEGLYLYGGNPILASMARSGFDAVFQLNRSRADLQGIWDVVPGLHIAGRSGCLLLGLDGREKDAVEFTESLLHCGNGHVPGYIVATNRQLGRQVVKWLGERQRRGRSHKAA